MLVFIPYGHFINIFVLIITLKQKMSSLGDYDGLVVRNYSCGWFLFPWELPYLFPILCATENSNFCLPHSPTPLQVILHFLFIYLFFVCQPAQCSNRHLSTKVSQWLPTTYTSSPSSKIQQTGPPMIWPLLTLPALFFATPHIQACLSCSSMKRSLSHRTCCSICLERLFSFTLCLAGDTYWFIFWPERTPSPFPPYLCL